MDDMIDPLGDRVMKNVPPISRYPLSRDKLWHISGRELLGKNGCQICIIVLCVELGYRSWPTDSS